MASPSSIAVRARKKAACLHALAAKPDDVGLLCELGWICRANGEQVAAEVAFRRAVALEPSSEQARYGLAVTCLRRGRVEEGIEHIRVCLERSPKNHEYWSVLAKMHRNGGRIAEARVHLRTAMALAPDDSRTVQRMLYQSLLDPDVSPIEVRQEHERWAARFAAPHYPASPPLALPLLAGERLRLGYVSPDWGEHPVGQLSESFLRHHDRTRYEVFCYSCGESISARAQALSRLPEHWVEAAGMTDEALSARIRNDRIHLLIDLAGHTRGGRLAMFARQPAPVQATYLGYPATTGVATIGYRLTDALADPPGLTDAHCMERLVRIPVCGWSFVPAQQTPAVSAPPCARTGVITFGNFGNFHKASSILELWSEVLRRIPRSQLLLRGLPFADAAVRASTRRRFAGLGIEEARITLRAWEPDWARHLSAYGEIDIALDSFPYHGTATTLDALYMGVPVVTLAGDSHVSRVGVSLLSSVGLAASCVAVSAEDFVAKAVRLAEDNAALGRLRLSLRAHMEQSPLMDGRGFTRNLETALDEIWRDALARTARRAGEGS